MYGRLLAAVKGSGLYRDNGKENGSYYGLVYKGYVGFYVVIGGSLYL